MSPESPSTMHDVIEPAFKAAAILNEKLADEKLAWDRKTKTAVRKEVNKLKEMMNGVFDFKKDIPGDVIEGMEEVIRNTEAKLDGKPMIFKADVDDGEITADSGYSLAA